MASITAQEVQAAISAAVQQSRDELSHQFNAQVQALKAQNETLMAILTKPSQRRAVLPDVEKLIDPEKNLDVWLSTMGGKLDVDGAAIGDAKSQFWYVHSRLDSSVKLVMDPLLHHALETQTFDHGKIVKALKRLYHNPLKRQQATKKLRHLKQGDKTFAKFLSEWEYQTWLAGEAADLPDNLRITNLRHSLSSSLQKRLDYRETDEKLPSDYDTFVELLHKLAHGVTFSTTNSYRPADTNRMDTSLGMVHDVNTLDQPASNLAKLLEAEAEVEVEPGDESSQAAVGRRIAQSTTRKQRKEWMDNKLCARCGGNHPFNNCPYDPYIVAPVGRVTVSAPYSDSESDTYSDIYD